MREVLRGTFTKTIAQGESLRKQRRTKESRHKSDDQKGREKHQNERTQKKNVGLVGESEVERLGTGNQNKWGKERRKIGERGKNFRVSAMAIQREQIMNYLTRKKNEESSKPKKKKPQRGEKKAPAEG